jgi:chromosomal replication initiation ATPase DnaA
VSEPTQLALDLGHRPALQRDDFLVTAANASAAGWLDRWPNWPSAGLVLFGPEGSGKSHLAAIWRQRSGAVGVAAKGLRDELVPDLAGASALLFDPISFPSADERACLHLLNLVHERKGHVLFVSREPPSRWPIVLPDLKSRLRALPAVGVGPPDETLLASLLVKWFGERQLAVDDGVVVYLAARVERSFAVARSLVDALDRAALAGHRRITVPLARDILQTFGNREGN